MKTAGAWLESLEDKVERYGAALQRIGDHHTYNGWTQELIDRARNTLNDGTIPPPERSERP